MTTRGEPQWDRYTSWCLLNLVVALLVVVMIAVGYEPLSDSHPLKFTLLIGIAVYAGVCMLIAPLATARAREMERLMENLMQARHEASVKSGD